MADYDALLRLTQGIWAEELRQRKIQFRDRIHGINATAASRGIGRSGAHIKMVFDASLDEIRIRAKATCEVVCRAVSQTRSDLPLNRLHDLYSNTITDMYQDIDAACKDVLNVIPVPHNQQLSYIHQLGELQCNAIDQQKFELELFHASPLPSTAKTNVTMGDVHGAVQIGDSATANFKQIFGSADLTSLTQAVQQLLAEVRAGNDEQRQVLVPIIVRANSALAEKSPKPKRIAGYLQAAATLMQTLGNIPSAWLVVRAAAAAVGIPLP